MTRIEYIDDCKRIQEILLIHGWEATLSECQELWRHRSGKDDGMWLHVPTGEMIMDQIDYYCGDCPVWNKRYNP